MSTRATFLGLSRISDEDIKAKLISFLEEDTNIGDEVEEVTIPEAAMAAGYNFDTKGPNRDYIGGLGAYARPRLDHLATNPFKNVHAPHKYPINHPEVIAVIKEFCQERGIKPSKNNTYKVDSIVDVKEINLVSSEIHPNLERELMESITLKF